MTIWNVSFIIASGGSEIISGLLVFHLVAKLIDVVCGDDPARSPQAPTLERQGQVCSVVTVKPYSVQVVSKRTELTDCFIVRINNSLKKRQSFIELNRSSGSGHTVDIYTKRRFQLRIFMNGLNTNVVNPVLKEIVFIGT